MPELLPVAAGDYPYVRKVNRWLNDSLRKAADANSNVEYVDVWAASEGHDLCSDDPWIQGPVNDNRKALAYHPFAAEQQAVADLIVRQLARAPEGS